MRLQELAQASGRLAIANDKAAEELTALLQKWFAKHFLKGIKLPLLKTMYGTEAFNAFTACLTEHGEAAVITVLRKLDPHRDDILDSDTNRDGGSHPRACSGSDPTHPEAEKREDGQRTIRKIDKGRRDLRAITSLTASVTAAKHKSTSREPPITHQASRATVFPSALTMM